MEVVCLTCSDTTPQALQAPLLLSLLLQRASPGVRAAYLNSEDGTRLLVALQLGMPLSGSSPHMTPGTSTWSFYNRAGALSLYDIAADAPALPWQFPPATRAAFILAWCFLEVDPDAAGAAAAAIQHAAVDGATVQATTPAAVADGSVLCVAGWCWAGELQLDGGCTRGTSRQWHQQSMQACQEPLI
jgi:hypothetical protein